MNTKFIAIAAVLRGIPRQAAAQAQTLTVTEASRATSPSFTYTYMVPRRSTMNQLICNFSDTDFTSVSSSGPLTLTPIGRSQPAVFTRLTVAS